MCSLRKKKTARSDAREIAVELLAHTAGPFKALDKLDTIEGIDELDGLDAAIESANKAVGFPSKHSMEDDLLCQLSIVFVMLDYTVKQIAEITKCTVKQITGSSYFSSRNTCKVQGALLSALSKTNMTVGRTLALVLSMMGCAELAVGSMIRVGDDNQISVNSSEETGTAKVSAKPEEIFTITGDACKPNGKCVESGNPYGNNEKCVIELKQSTGTKILFKRFNTEKCCDILTVPKGQTSIKWSGVEVFHRNPRIPMFFDPRWPMPMGATAVPMYVAPNTKITWTSNGGDQYDPSQRRWKFCAVSECSELNKNSCNVRPDCWWSGTLTRCYKMEEIYEITGNACKPSRKCVESGQPYFNNEKCEIKLKMNLQIRFERFNTEYCCDLLYVKNGAGKLMQRLSGSTTLGRVYKWNSGTTITWKTDNGHTNRGWKFCAISEPLTAAPTASPTKAPTPSPTKAPTPSPPTPSPTPSPSPPPVIQVKKGEGKVHRKQRVSLTQNATFVIGTLPIGTTDVSVTMSANADLDLFAQKRDAKGECLAGYYNKCKLSKKGATGINGMTIQFSGDDQDTPVSESLSIDKVTIPVYIHVHAFATAVGDLDWSYKAP